MTFDINAQTKVLCFGELLLRLSPQEHRRLEQACVFNAFYGGAEANVACSLALQGDHSAYMSVVPAHRIGQNAIRSLKMWGVDTSSILQTGDRLGTYFFEVGSSVRSNQVVYDRKYSAFSLESHTSYDWDSILEGIGIFYFSGVTPAISHETRTATFEALQACRRLGIVTACDLNYRSKMWSEQEARACMKELLPLVDIVIANDEDAPATLGIKHGSCDLSCGIDEKESYELIARDICHSYGCKLVASVIRNIQSVEKSQWMAMVYDHEVQEAAYSSIHDMNVLEGVAAGDAFAAGLLHGLLHGFDIYYLSQYAIAASVLKLTIPGDTNIVSASEIEALAHASHAGVRVSR